MISLGLSLSKSFLEVEIDWRVLVNSSPSGSISLILACHAPSSFLGGLSRKPIRTRLMLKAMDDACHHYKEVGHYLAELIKNKKQVGTVGSSSIFVIELFSISNKSWVYDTGCGKMTRKSFPHRTERAIDLLGLIHIDVCGPFKHVSRQGASYFITFTNGYSRYGYVYLLKHKPEVFETFKVFKYEVENQLGKNIKALRSDRGGEYISQEFKDYLKACGIVQQHIPPYTTQHNDVFETMKHTLLDMVRSMMNLTTLSLSFWDYALESAIRILNMVLTKKRCEALVKRDTPVKLQQRYVKCIFIGYPKEMMGYYFYFPPENKIVVARYVEFLEKNFISQEVSGRDEELEEIQDKDTSLLRSLKVSIM
ncbi:retrotransposon protein, putative, ty1-copia subclass [Tanacetum coccineum]